ncbi:MAG: tyrosine-type recombinase/integrase [Desulfobacterales bacterium]|nr:tyrosine-type recombinase/integrase [Desulfobacterales bacterium]
MLGLKYKNTKGRYGPTYHIKKGVWVRKNQDGKWLLFFEKNGNRQNKTIGFGKKGLRKAIIAAEAVAKNLDTLCHSGSADPNEASKPKFVDFAKQWLESNQERWDEYTYERYEQILRLHIEPHACFKKPIDQVTRTDIKSKLRNLFNRRAPRTVEAVHAVLSSIFNEAIDDGLCEANPTRLLLRRILPPKTKRDLKKPDPFPVKERDLFEDTAQRISSRTEQMLLRIMAYAGLRLGEALAMRFEYFDPERKTYTVCQSYKRHNFKKPKGGKTRVVDLPDYLVEELDNYIRYLRKEGLKTGRGGEVDLLFEDPQEPGGSFPLSQRKAQRLVQRVCKAAGLKVRNPHDLRHTYATIMLMAHQSPAYVQRQLGHSSYSITVDCYCHWIPGEGRADLEGALQGRVRKPDPKSHIIAYKPKRLQ